jgi:hypothetical protein
MKPANPRCGYGFVEGHKFRTRTRTLNYLWLIPVRVSIPLTITMLGRVRRRQVDDNPSLDQMRPAMTSRCLDFYKSVMVQAQRLRLAYANSCCIESH